LAKAKLIITLLVIILFVSGIYFGMSYLREQGKHKVLYSQITDITQTLEQIPESPQGMEQRLAAAQAGLFAVQNDFPGKVNSTHIINTILKLAENSNIRIIPVKTQPWSIETVREHSYHVFRLDIAVEGSFPRLMTFVSQLEDGEFQTLILEDLSVTRLSAQSQEGNVSESAIHVAADLSLAIYAQSPISN